MLFTCSTIASSPISIISPLDAIALQTSPSIFTLPLLWPTSIVSVTIAVLPINAFVLVCTCLLFLWKYFIISGRTATNDANVAIEKHISCPFNSISNSEAIAAAIAPTEIQKIANQEVKISIMNKRRAIIIQICQVSMMFKVR